jgi:hypothetical protein
MLLDNITHGNVLHLVGDGDGLMVVRFFGCLLPCGSCGDDGRIKGWRWHEMQSCLVPLSLQGAAFELPFFFDVVSFINGHMLYQATRALRCI